MKLRKCCRERLIETGLGRVRIRPIATFAGYWIGEDGSIWTSRPLGNSKTPPPVLRRVADYVRQAPNRGFGYSQVCLRRKGSRTVHTHYVHALVLTAFIGPRPTPEHEGCHWNAVRTDNRLWNLRWGTPFENAADKKRTGRNLDPMTELRAELTAIAAGIDTTPIPF